MNVLIDGKVYYDLKKSYFFKKPYSDDFGFSKILNGSWEEQDLLRKYKDKMTLLNKIKYFI
jgi:hypothetical protein